MQIFYLCRLIYSLSIYDDLLYCLLAVAKHKYTEAYLLAWLASYILYLSYIFLYQFNAKYKLSFNFSIYSSFYSHYRARSYVWYPYMYLCAIVQCIVVVFLLLQTYRVQFSGKQYSIECSSLSFVPVFFSLYFSYSTHSQSDFIVMYSLVAS